MDVIEAGGLGKRCGRKWALRDCTPSVPAGCMTGLVGPNGAGNPNLGKRQFSPGCVNGHPPALSPLGCLMLARALRRG
jgi:hypothetical protein